MKISHIFLIWILYFILILIWAHRIKKFSLFVDSIQSLMFFFFSLDHYNYAHWLAVLLRDMRDSFSVNWVVSKTCHRFLALPSDQVPEQEDAHVCKVKGRLHRTDRKRRYFTDMDDCWTRKTYIFLQLKHILIAFIMKKDFQHKKAKSLGMSVKYMKIILKTTAQNCLHWTHKTVWMNLLQLFSNK